MVRILIIIISCCHLIATAQGDNFQFKHLSSSTGLSQSSVIALEQDSLGVMWIGTRDGLNFYDGHDFNVFPASNELYHSLSSSDILSLKNGANHQLWVGTYNGLHLIDVVTKEMVKKYPVSSDPSITGNLIYDIEILSNDQVFIATEKGLSVIDGKSKEVINSNLLNYSVAVYDLYDASNGITYIGTDAGLFLYDKAKKQLVSTDSQFSDYAIQSMLISKDRQLYLGTKFNGLLSVDVSNGSYEQVQLGEKVRDIRDLIYDNQGRLWIGSYQGVFVQDTAGTLNHLKSSIDNENGLRKNSVKCFFNDQSGSIWIGTYNGGVHLWNASNNAFINYKESLDNTGLNNTVVSALEFNDEYLYIATEQGGVNILNRSTNLFQYLTAANEGLLENNVKSLLLHQQQLWIGLQSKGIQVWDLKGGSWIDNNITNELKVIINPYGVYDMAHKEGVIYLATFGNGLVVYDLTSNTILRHIKEQDGLSSNYIRKVHLSGSSSIWVATQNGLNKINADGSIDTYLASKEPGPGVDILDLYEDGEQNLWIGTKAHGLYVFKDGKLQRQGIISDSFKYATVHGIIRRAGKLWLSTNHGVLEYDPGDAKILRVLEASNGLVGNEFSDGAIELISDGDLAVGGISGLSIIPITELSTDNYAPAVQLASFKVSNNQGENRNTFPNASKVDLNYRENSFSISFMMPVYHNRGRVAYLYRLKGLNNEWKHSYDNTVKYTLQDAGDYIFEVKGVNASGVTSNSITTLEISLSPAPWFSWWAYLLYLLIILGIIYAFFQSFKRRTQLVEAIKFEQKEQERIKETNESKLRFFTNISHEFRTPLTLILGPLQQILSSYKGSPSMYKKILVVESNAKHLRSLIDRLMDFRKLEKQHVELQTAQGNIVKFLKEIYLSFSEHAKAGNYRYDFETTHDDIQVYYDRHKLERVLFNLLSNAFKFTPSGGKIKVSVHKKSNQVLIEVQDNGIGIEVKDTDKIFDRFYEVAAHTDKSLLQQQGTGIGLNIAKNIVELHKGTITVHSELNAGSIFKVTLLLGRDHLTDDQIIPDFKFSDDVSHYAALQVKQTSPEQPDLDVPPDGERLKILLVEDNKGLRSFIKDLLSETYKIYQAENGKEAFQIATAENPDLIISDVVMPIMTGTELCSQLKEDLRTSHIPVILLTSRSSLIYKLEGLESGADDYISKPFDVQEFKLRIHNLLRTKKRLTERLTTTTDYTPEHIEVSSVDEEMLKKAIAIVEKNIPNEQFDIPMFSSELGVSRTMLFIKVKAWTNFTPNEFIQHFRMKRAAQLLQTGKLNISEVSYKVGFKNPKYFSKCFFKAYGDTPTNYIRKFTS